MNSTAIAWTDYTWNLFSGCRKISPECKFCYAETLSERHRGNAAFPHGFDLTVRTHKLREPSKLLKSSGPSLIFCESMSDIGLDDGELSSDERARLLAAGFMTMNDLRDAFFSEVRACEAHRFQVLTKRPAVLLDYLRRDGCPSNVWIGTTIGHPQSLDRLATLRRFREVDARVLFVSAEPLLGDLVAAGLRLDGIDWLIAGGESGTHASHAPNLARFLVARGPRGWAPLPSRVPWLRALRDEAARVGCAFFFKQWGGPRPDSAGRLLDGVEHDGMPVHVPGAMPERRHDLGHATAALARKRLPVAP